MIVEIITTGTELLLGEISNKNAHWLASCLNRYGFTVAYMTVVGDNPERLKETFRIALKRADIIITTGGLGSTLSDMTKKAGAEALKLPYVRFPEESKRLKEYYFSLNHDFIPALDRQAWFALGSSLFPNDAGSASGCAVESDGKYIIHLPGPPFEMQIMMERHVIPWLNIKFGSQGSIQSVILSVEHMSEAEIETKIGDILKVQTNPTIALLARPGYIAVRITARGKDELNALQMAENMAEIIKERIPVSGFQPETGLLSELHALLLNHSVTVSAAESCTGGLIGKLLTDMPGSSSYFKGSAVTYWNEAKEQVLSVKKATLDRFTAVSTQTALEMAEGSRKLYGSDIAVSTTGYAGPGKGERGESPGLVYIGIAGPLGTFVYEEHFMGSRQSVRYGAADKALYYIFKYLQMIMK